MFVTIRRRPATRARFCPTCATALNGQSTAVQHPQQLLGFVLEHAARRASIRGRRPATLGVQLVHEELPRERAAVEIKQVASRRCRAASPHSRSPRGGRVDAHAGPSP